MRLNSVLSTIIVVFTIGNAKAQAKKETSWRVVQCTGDIEVSFPMDGK